MSATFDDDLRKFEEVRKFVRGWMEQDLREARWAAEDWVKRPPPIQFGATMPSGAHVIVDREGRYVGQIAGRHSWYLNELLENPAHKVAMFERMARLLDIADRNQDYATWFNLAHAYSNKAGFKEEWFS